MNIEFSNGVILEAPDEMFLIYPYAVGFELFDPTAASSEIMRICIGCDTPIFAFSFLGVALAAGNLLSDTLEGNAVIAAFNPETEQWEMAEMTLEDLRGTGFFPLALSPPEYEVDIVFTTHDIKIWTLETFESIIDTGLIAIPKDKNTIMSAPYSFFKRIADTMRAYFEISDKFNSNTLLTALENVDDFEVMNATILRRTKVTTDAELLSVLDGSMTELVNDEITVVPSSAFSRAAPSSSSIDPITSSPIKLRKIYLPNAVEIKGSAFACQSSLNEVYIPKVQKIGNDAFKGCGYLGTSIDFQELTELSDRCFWKCGASKFIFHKSVLLDWICFRDCSIPVFDFHKAFAEGSAGSGAFSNSSVSTLIIRDTEKIPEIQTQTDSDLMGTPIANGTGYIYVPSSMVDAYKADANWSVYASQIRAIEDYPDICGE